MLVDAYANSFGLPPASGQAAVAFQNTCIDALVEVFDEYAIGDARFLNHVARVLEGHGECGVRRLISL